MAIAFDAASSFATAGAVSVGMPHTTSGSQRVLLVFIAVFGTTSPTSVTYNAVPMTFVGAINSPAGDAVRIEVWRLVAPTLGLNFVGVSFAAITRFVVGAVSYTGVDQITPITFTASTSGSGTPISVGVTPVLVGNHCVNGTAVDCGAGLGTPVIAVTGGETQRINNRTAGAPNNNNVILGVSDEPSAPPTDTMTWSNTLVVPWAQFGLELRIGPPEDLFGISTSTSDAVGVLTSEIEMFGTSLSTSDALGVLEPPPPAAIDLSAAPNAFTSRITVRKMTWAPNQARVLEFEQAIKVTDFANMLAIGSAVVYTDPDLGTIFVGHIFERQRNIKTGEGVVYRAADPYRFLQKEPARISCNDSVPQYSNPPSRLGSTHIHILEDALVTDCISTVMSSVMQPGWNFFGGGITHTLNPALTIYKALDKGGMSIGTWIDDVLDQTEGGAAYVEPFFNGSDWVHRLRVYDYYLEPDVNLLVGNYDATAPQETTPLVVESDIKDSVDQKYYKVTVEGGGDYERKVEVYVAPIYCGAGPTCINPPGCTTYQTRIRFYFDETNVVGFFYDGNGNCQNQVHFEFKAFIVQGNPPLGSTSQYVLNQKPHLDMDAVNFCTGQNPNPLKCKWYVEVLIVQGGIGPGGSGVPPAPILNDIKFSYTVYNGPFVAQSPASPAPANTQLIREGEYVLQRPELTKFYSPGRMVGVTVVEQARNDDPIAEMQDIADRYYRRYSQLVNTAGSITVHIKGATGSIRPGSRIANFGPNSNVRVRSLEFDFVARNITLEVSDHPLREFIREAKDTKINQQKEHKNWRDREPAALSEPCLPNVAMGKTADGCTCIIVDDFAQGGY